MKSYPVQLGNFITIRYSITIMNFTSIAYKQIANETTRIEAHIALENFSLETDSFLIANFKLASSIA